MDLELNKDGLTSLAYLEGLRAGAEVWPNGRAFA
jgi:hypothetical protein